MEEIKEGDVVTLKSDAANTFTVGKFLTMDGTRYARVYWYDYTSKELKAENIPVIALIKSR